MGDNLARVGFLGTGHIAAPMARAVARKDHQVTVSARNADVAANLAASGLGITVGDNQTVLDRSEVVILCLRPAIWSDVVAPLKFRSDQAVISVMAGVSLANLKQACAPASEVSITLPLTFVEFGGCPLATVGDTTAVRALFGDDNPVLPLADETALAAHFATSTVVSAVLTSMQSAADWLGAQTGDPAEAETFVSTLLAGYLRELPKTPQGALAADLAALASPNTLNRQMADAMIAADLPKELTATFDRILERVAKTSRAPSPAKGR